MSTKVALKLFSFFDKLGMCSNSLRITKVTGTFNVTYYLFTVQIPNFIILVEKGCT